MSGFGFGFDFASRLVGASAGTGLPAFAAAAPQGVDFGARNGDAASGVPQAWLSGPTLTNVFGDRNSANNAGGARPGMIAVTLRLQAGLLTSVYSSGVAGQIQALLGNSAGSGTRGMRVAYYPFGQASAGFRNRFVLQGAFANAARMGDFDATTGAAGSVAGTSGLRTAAVDPHSDEVITLAIRMTAGNVLRIDHIIAGGDIIPGDQTAHLSTAGMATPNGAFDFGRQLAGTSLQTSFQGSQSNFIQLDNRDVTDVELQRWARGESPDTIWSASTDIAVFYPLAGPTALTKTIGFKTAAAMIANGTLLSGPAMLPAGNGSTYIALLPEFAGFVHALPPATVAAAANRAAVKASSGPVLFRVKLGGAGSTHVIGRVRRKSDDTIIATARMTIVPLAAGTYWLEVPGVPVGIGYIREVVREDALTAVVRDSDEHRVGLTTPGPSQSQGQIAWFGAAFGGVQDATTLTGLVSVVTSAGFNGNSVENSPAFGMILNRNNMLGPAAAQFAAAYEAQADGIPLMIIPMARVGTSRNDWMSPTTSTDTSLVGTAATFPWTGNLWGDSIDPATGLVTRTMLKSRLRFSFWMEQWVTSDQTAIAASPTAFAAMNNEIYAGEGTSGIRQHFSKFALAYPIRLAGIPASRHRNTGAAAPTEANANSWQLPRQYQRGYYQGTGMNAAMQAGGVAAYLNDFVIGAAITESAHADRTTTAAGNPRYAARLATAVMTAGKILSANPETGWASASRSGAVITITASLANAGTLDPRTALAAVVGFEVSETGSSGPWSRPTGAIPFTAAQAGNTVTLTKGSAWAANTQVRYLFGYPWHIGSGTNATDFAAENTAVEGQMCETLTGADGGKIALAPTFTPLVAA